MQAFCLFEITSNDFAFEDLFSLKSFYSSGWARTRKATAWRNTCCHERGREAQSGQNGPWLRNKMDWKP